MYIWDVERLWELARSLKPFDVSIEDLFEIDRDCWFCDVKPATIRNVALHAKRIYEADLSYPIILNADGALMDGGHRIAKALLLGMTSISAVRFEQMPLPDCME
jgi:hypothetical protein